jgi:hypothetical protein
MQFTSGILWIRQWTFGFHKKMESHNLLRDYYLIKKHCFMDFVHLRYHLSVIETFYRCARRNALEIWMKKSISKRTPGRPKENAKMVLQWILGRENVNWTNLLWIVSIHELFFLVSWGGVRLSALGTSATNWPTVPAPDGRWWAWSSRWNENWQGKPKY